MINMMDMMSMERRDARLFYLTQRHGVFRDDVRDASWCRRGVGMFSTILLDRINMMDMMSTERRDDRWFYFTQRARRTRSF